jgi:uncharacterized protein (TIGR02001 family)
LPCALAACLAALPWLAGLARAEGFSAVASVASSYPYRGYSKSDNGPTVRASLDYSHRSGGFAGVWVGWVNFGDSGYANRSDVEFYPYLGFGFAPAGGLRVEVSVARYVFNGYIFGRPSDYNEYSAALQLGDWLTARLNASNDGYGRGGSIVDGELSGRYPLTANLSASAGIGYNHATASLAESALYWNLGLTWFFRRAALDVRYVDAAELPPPSSGRQDASLPDLRQNFVLSVTVGF